MNGCIETTARRGAGGYGRLWFEGRMWMAHRLAWTQAHGPIPRGLFVLHSCDNPPCINPDHLFLGTQLDNMRDAAQKGRLVSANAAKDRCPAGHPYDETNTYRRPDRPTSRGCKACKREQFLAFHERKRVRS